MPNRIANCNARISVRSPQIQVRDAYRRKKTLFPQRNRAGQDGTVVHARGCLSTSNHLNLIELLLRKLLSYRQCRSCVNRCYLRMLPLRSPALLLLLSLFPLRLSLPLLMLSERQPHHSPVLRLRLHLAANPLLLRAYRVDCALLHCFYCLLPYCPAAFDDHGKLPSTVRFKTTRGMTASMGSVFCRAMENSVCECIRTQLREPRGFAGLIWRIDVTGGFGRRCAAADALAQTATGGSDGTGRAKRSTTTNTRATARSPSHAFSSNARAKRAPQQATPPRA
ncbi:hypothetical protein LMG27177_04805 [Paraburkholderia fynbosensis]|uniref:Uncharacterized protein n=1 Tax=Paraburkholderia fynbosensis TaxID=1200993 RepID=A0A6J5GGJ4_9BURK|nr:hypothetical protein LMG27177_04805 [Paraburkholderia fynbosensis]